MNNETCCDILQSFRLGTHVVFDAARLRLLHTSTAVKRHRDLSPVQAQVLYRLVRSSWVILPQNELLSSAPALSEGTWSASADVAQVVLELRRALEHIDPSTCYIRILPRLGYALTANVWSANSQPRLP
ncbi:hypothetical protein AAGS40_29755 (plasmid) [Paraburkholderia sp. PREW-6R]|uniref:winged helix-turn-helix domain-containing protein n=1 Tax=Paraburkholderia sp. PREW-6R TaxID=3141544 RepID=UPI0031F50DF7